MTNDMRKRGVAATNGTTAELVKTAAPNAAPDAKTVTIDCTGGHFGISCTYRAAAEGPAEVSGEPPARLAGG